MGRAAHILDEEQQTRQALTINEREIVFTISDDEATWHVFTDSRRAFSTRLLRVAKALGIEPMRTGLGWEFTLPLKAIRVGIPRKVSEAQREAARKGFDASLGSKSSRIDRSAERPRHTRPPLP